MDEELRQLDLAIVQARRLATESLAALRAPQATLRTAAADYIESVARRWVDASRRASVPVMAQLSDSDMAELRYWTEQQIASVRSAVERDIEACEFWISESSGLSLADVNAYDAALMPRPKDSASGIPQALVFLFERSLHPLRRGLAVVGLVSAHAEAERRLETALVRAWRVYREKAIECIARWADIDERYQASAARFQELRWDFAGEVDVAEIQARRAAESRDEEKHTVADDAAAAAALAAARVAAAEADGPVPDDADGAPLEAIVRSDSETLIPVIAAARD